MPPFQPRLPLTALCVRCNRPFPPRNRILIQTSQPISTYGYEQAKALVYTQHGQPNDVLSLHPHSISPPHSSLVTLRALAAPLNPADINQIQGTYASLPPFTTALGTPKPSAVPGNEGVFEVLSTGSEAKNLKRGDWVIPRQTGLGCWRTHVQCQAEDVLRIEKEGLDVKQVAGVSVNPVTADCLLNNFWDNPDGIEEGSDTGIWYIQNGANSGVGRMVTQIGRMQGFRGISVIRGRKNKEEEEALRKEMLDLGAHKCVTDAELAQKGFKDQIQEWLNGGRDKLKLGLNCVGGDAALGMAKLLSNGATMVTYGAMGRAPLKIPTSMLIFKDLRFTGFWVSQWAQKNPEDKKLAVERILALYREGNLKESPTVDVRWDWDTKGETLVEAVQGTLEGYRKGKGMFVFGET